MYVNVDRVCSISSEASGKDRFIACLLSLSSQAKIVRYLGLARSRKGRLALYLFMANDRQQQVLLLLRIKRRPDIHKCVREQVAFEKRLNWTFLDFFFADAPIFLSLAFEEEKRNFPLNFGDFPKFFSVRDAIGRKSHVRKKIEGEINYACTCKSVKLTYDVLLTFNKVRMFCQRPKSKAI